MSINVNVTGNPISIKGPKMVTADPNFDGGEFQKRRRIRIQQVRQQSRDIAESVRNKVRKEKGRQWSEVERRGADELRKWQARKLISLQEQYNDCLRDVGLGHAQASLEEEQEDLLLMERECNQKVMRERGVDAMQKLKDKIERDKKDRLDRAERRKYNKVVENTRSAMVVGLQKSKSPFKKKKKVLANIDIVVSDTESELEVPVNTRRFSTSDVPESTERVIEADLPVSSHRYVEDNDTFGHVVYPLDTRISDRIKRRKLKSASCTSDGLISNGPETVPSEPTRVPTPEIPNRELPVKEIFKYDNERYRQPSASLQMDLPSKPPLRVRPTARTQMSSASGNKVPYYDHQNRFTTVFEPLPSSVHRVSADSIEVCPSTGSEAEYVEQLYKRDKEAQERGKRAMEKVKVRRDYKEMMDHLSKLQKRERIASIASTKPQVHMSQERLKEYERKRQNRLENAYEKFFPQVQMVTIPPRSPTPPPSPKKTKTLGVWDFDNKSGQKSPKLNARLASDDKETLKRSEDLKKMLKSLTEQRDKVVKELQLLPKTSKLHNILGDLNCIDQILEKGKAITKPSGLPSKQSQPPPSVSSKMKPQDLNKKPQPENKIDIKMPPSKQKPVKKLVYASETIPKTSPGPSRPTTPPAASKPKTAPKQTFQQSVSTQTGTADAVAETEASKSDKAVNTSMLNEKPKQQAKCKCAPKQKGKDQCEIIIKICDHTSNQKKPQKSTVPAIQPTVYTEKVQSETRNRSSSWRDILVQNNSTSTSYCSPPDFQPVIPKNQKKSVKHILKDIPQQRNILNDTISSVDLTKKNHCLQDNIKRLLAMSPGSIEELTVSTVSDVSTPTMSIIEMESNNPRDVLGHVMKHFNSSKETNEKTIEHSSPVSPKLAAPKAIDIGCQCLDDYASENYPEVLTTYNKMAESCAKKIENLASMIERVRLEKQDILQGTFSGSEKEDSTKYLDLPTNQDLSSSPISAEQEELTKNLLRTAFNYSDVLHRQETNDVYINNLDMSNNEMMERFRKLKDTDVSDRNSQPDALWLDIPRLPKFEENHNLPSSVSKPPPSRGITIAMRQHQDLNIIPHELSAIPEVDSFISNKPHSERSVSKERSPQKGTKNSPKDKLCQIDCKDSSSSISLPDIVSEIDAANGNKVSTEDSSDKSSLNKSTGTISLISRSSSNDIDIETTLKNLGMGWAVTTLKKTQQSLALTSSSSSSIDISLKQQSADTSKLNGSSSVLSAFLQGLAFNTTPNLNSTSSGNKTSRKTSTPVPNCVEVETTKNMLSVESDISSIQRSSNNLAADFVQFYSFNEGSFDQSKDVN